MIKIAVKFFKKIKKKVLIIFGHDCDSIASAAIMFRLLKKLNKNPKLFIAEFNWGISKDDLKKIKRIKPDGILVLDIGNTPLPMMERLNKIAKVLLIDHHIPKKYKIEFYINPRLEDPRAYIPVSYLCWKIYSKYFDEKEIEWIAGIGTLADHGLEGNEDLFKKIRKDYPKLVSGRLTSKSLFSKSLLGKLVELVDSSRVVKGITGVKFATNLLISAKKYSHVLENKQLNEWYRMEKKELNKLIRDMKRNSRIFDGFVLYIFSSRFNLKSTLAGYSPEIFPNKVIAIAQKVDNYLEVSLRRSKKCDLSKLVDQIISYIPEAEGGGHPSAAAFRLPINKLDNLIEFFKNKKKKKKLLC